MKGLSILNFLCCAILVEIDLAVLEKIVNSTVFYVFSVNS